MSISSTHISSPDRIVVIGGNGFIGSHIVKNLNGKNHETLSLTRSDIDLLLPGSSDHLDKIVQPNDAIVIAIAEAPVKNSTMFMNNIVMMNNVCKFLEKKSVRNILYISSDAVYNDSDKALIETSTKAPDNLHGMMHAAREIMLTSYADCPLAFIRPTLVYGEGDPHNGYGPNRFLKTAQDNNIIQLFGNGEERRDHVFVEDVAELSSRMVLMAFNGSLNAATGKVYSFMEIANAVAERSTNEVKIETSPRQGEMPHNGYRPFDSSKTSMLFPDFQYTDLISWIKSH